MKQEDPHSICHATTDALRRQIGDTARNAHADAAADMALGFWLRTLLTSHGWKTLHRDTIEHAAADHPAVVRARS